jgi:hypothetical protein
MICSYTGSKLETYTKKEDAKMTMKDWLFDFYVVEEIIRRVEDKHPGEALDVYSMFPKAMEPLFNMLNEIDQSAQTSEVDQTEQKNGLRIVLILVLLLCVFSKSHHVEEDMIEFWKTYHFVINTEHAFPNDTAVYDDMLCNMIHLMIGFQHDTVRMLCSILYINAIK